MSDPMDTMISSSSSSSSSLANSKALADYWQNVRPDAFDDLNRKALDRVASAFRCQHDKRVTEHRKASAAGTRATLAMLFIAYEYVRRAKDGLEGILGDVSKYRDVRVTRDHDRAAFVAFMYHDTGEGRQNRHN